MSSDQKTKINTIAASLYLNDLEGLVCLKKFSQVLEDDSVFKSFADDAYKRIHTNTVILEELRVFCGIETELFADKFLNDFAKLILIYQVEDC